MMKGLARGPVWMPPSVSTPRRLPDEVSVANQVGDESRAMGLLEACLWPSLLAVGSNTWRPPAELRGVRGLVQSQAVRGCPMRRTRL